MVTRRVIIIFLIVYSFAELVRSDDGIYIFYNIKLYKLAHTVIECSLYFYFNYFNSKVLKYTEI